MHTSHLTSIYRAPAMCQDQDVIASEMWPLESESESGSQAVATYKSHSLCVFTYLKSENSKCPYW